MYGKNLVEYVSIYCYFERGKWEGETEKAEKNEKTTYTRYFGIVINIQLVCCCTFLFEQSLERI